MNFAYSLIHLYRVNVFTLKVQVLVMDIHGYLKTAASNIGMYLHFNFISQ